MKTFLFPILLLCALAFPMTTTAETKTETLVVGGGCFWCLDATYRLVPGVKDVVSGYAGGSVPNPTYRDVCSGATGHAEVVKIVYDPAQVSLEKLLGFFWTVHDPTTLNYQGNDHGTQYRSIILYTTDAQKIAAEKAIAAEQKKLSEKIVTELVPLKEFYPAEDYHQDYFRKNPGQGYCQFVVKPKVSKAQKTLKSSEWKE
ncbi:MAG: peptide-methionine (S)-S-oxide reductase MsrA [Nibricoccus sp.]